MAPADPRPEIRPEEPRDAAVVFAIHAAAFGRDGEARLVDALRSTAKPQVSLVAEHGGTPIAHVFFSPVRCDRAPAAAGPPPMGLAPLAVAPAHQRRGAGGALVHAGLEACRALRAPLVFVLGHPAYYPRFGFRPAGPLGFTYARREAGPSFMVYELEPGAARRFGGEVRFLPAFDALEET